MDEIVQRFKSSAPVDVSGLAEALGVHVWESSQLPSDVAGQIIKDPINGGPSGYSIKVRSSDPYVRKRFTVAHELGHFVMHKKSIGDFFSEDFMYRSNLPSQQEIEANRYAADLLMPRPLLQKHLEIYGPDVHRLALVFEVSEAAMKIRLEGILRPGSGNGRLVAARNAAGAL